MENSNGKPSSSCRAGSPSDADGGSVDADETQDKEPSSSQNAPNELDNFRLQWKREIESPTKVKILSKSNISPVDTMESVEDKARWFFLRGVQAERSGKLQDAISFYRRAIQLVPDIEFRIDENTDYDTDDYFDESDESHSDDSSEDDDVIDNLVEKLQKILDRPGTTSICMPKLDQMNSHISSLPPEIFIYILKWVISQDLDVVSLEQIAKVCRGFYLCARDNEIWRLICLRTWDTKSDTSNRYGTWRNMFLQRPRVCFNGVYISKTTYVRYGESSFQDANYRPCYLVEYYRYLRFFPDGVILMLTTPDDPYQSVYQLCHKKSNKHPNVMSGRYKIVGSTVMAVVKKQKNENASSNYFRMRRQRPPNLQETQDQTFHLELEIKNVKKRVNCQLSWNRYSIHNVYRNGQESVSNFDIVPSKYPSFWFSRVKSFTSESESPLR